MVLPVAASMAATWLKLVLTYRTPATIMGVPSFSQVSIPGLDLRISASGDFHRQAILSLITFEPLIWSRGDYFEFLLLPPYTGHSAPFGRCRAELCHFESDER